MTTLTPTELDEVAERLGRVQGYLDSAIRVLDLALGRARNDVSDAKLVLVEVEAFVTELRDRGEEADR